MAESHGDGLLDFVYGILPVAESPRAESNAWDGVAWKKACRVHGKWEPSRLTTGHTVVKFNEVPGHGEGVVQSGVWRMTLLNAAVKHVRATRLSLWL